MEQKENIMASVDASKFILIARDHLGGRIPEKDPFAKEGTDLLTDAAKKGMQVSAPLYSKSGMSIAVQGYMGMKTTKSARLVIMNVAQIKRNIKNVVNKTKEIMGAFIGSAGKTARITGRSINTVGKGTKMTGDMAHTAGDAVNETAEASAAIPVADLVTVPTGMAAGTAVKGVGAIGKGIGRLEELSGQTIESGGKLVENTGSMFTKGTTDVASKVCHAMTRSGNIIVRTNGKVLSSMIKTTGKTVNVASFSLSKMYEGISKGVKCNEEKELIR